MIEYGARAKRLPAPPHVVWESLTRPRRPGARPWLNLLADEVEPTVIESARPLLVVWSSLWPARPDDQIRFELAADGLDTLTWFRLLTPAAPPDEATIGHLRKRLNVLLYADLRYSYGQ